MKREKEPTTNILNFTTPHLTSQHLIRSESYISYIRTCFLCVTDSSYMSVVVESHAPKGNTLSRGDTASSSSAATALSSL